MSREHLEQMWNEHLATPFPDVGDLTADLAGYNGDLAGLIQRVMRRQTLPSSIAIDHQLTKRIRETGHDEAIDYIEQLNEMAALAGSLHEETSVSCAFDLDHYAELLDAAKAGGYRFAFFEGAPAEGDLILRHDVDLSLDAALRLAELEAEAGAAATYFLMTGSVFYNLSSEEGERALARLRELGHRVGLHAVYPRLDLDDRFDPVVAWHNPDPEYMRAPVEGALNVMEPPWFDPETYRSDSNQHWRSGCPHEELRTGSFPWLQLLTHPEIWVYPGSRMGETMRAMLEEEKERRLDQLAADRIDLS